MDRRSSHFLAQLQEKIFSDEAIPLLAKQLTEFQAKKDESYKNEEVRLEKPLRGAEKQIENLVNAIAGGMTQMALLQKLDSLEQQKLSLEQQVAQHRAQVKKTAVTEDSLKQLLSSLKQHVAERNIPEIKKYICSYVEKVIVYKEHVELILRLNVHEMQNPQPHAVVDLHGGAEGS